MLQATSYVACTFLRETILATQEDPELSERSLGFDDSIPSLIYITLNNKE